MAEPGDLEDRLRADALDIVRAGIRAVDPADLVEAALSAEPVAPGAGGRLVVAAVGKAGAGMLRGARSALGTTPHEGIAVVPRGLEAEVPEGVDVHGAGHPLPDERGVRAARRLRDVAAGLGPRDRLLLLLSGGGSALLTLPAGPVELADLRAVTTLLLESGAPIDDLNAVRKHLEVLKGGGLARITSPAPVRALVLSDVIGDRLDVIASGPVTGDRTTFEDAVRVLRDRGVWERTPARVRARLEAGRSGIVADTPGPDEPVFRTVSVEVVGNSERAATAAARRAAELGYAVFLEPEPVTGEARDLGARLGLLAGTLAPGSCLLLAGETTVTVRGSGKGGRNQEVALAAAEALEGRADRLLFSVGTDGVDGPTDAAGALVSGRTMGRARSLGLDPADALARNDSYAFFEGLGDLVRTGPTGTNVMDLVGVLAAPAGLTPPGTRRT